MPRTSQVNRRHPRYHNQTGGGHTHPTTDIVSGIFTVARGGLGVDSFTTDSLIYFDGAAYQSVGAAAVGSMVFSVGGTDWSVLDAGAEGEVLQITSGVPQWGAIGSTHALDDHTGTLTPQKISKGAANTILITRADVEGSEPNWITLVAADIPAHGSTQHTGAIGAFTQITGTIATGQVSGSYTGITAVGTVGTGTWNGTKISSDYGGTGLKNTNITTGDILFSGDGTSWSTLGVSTDGFVLTLASGLPDWQALPAGAAHNLASATHAGDAAATGLIRGNAAGTAWEITSGGNTGDVLMLTSAAPNDVWAAVNLDATVVDAGIFSGAFTFDTKLKISATGELLQLADTSATGNPYMGFYQTSGRLAYIGYLDSGDKLTIAAEYGAVTIQAGVSGTEQERFYVSNTDTSDAAGSPYRGVAKATNAALFSEMYSHGTRSTATTCFGRAGNKQHMIISASLTTTITLEEDGQELTLYIQSDSGGPDTNTFAGVTDWADTDPTAGVIAALKTHVYHFERIQGNTVGYVISTGTLGAL